jgi:hypothetical protein
MKKVKTSGDATISAALERLGSLVVLNAGLDETYNIVLRARATEASEERRREQSDACRDLLRRSEMVEREITRVRAQVVEEFARLTPEAFVAKVQEIGVPTGLDELGWPEVVTMVQIQTGFTSLAERVKKYATG